MSEKWQCLKMAMSEHTYITKKRCNFHEKTKNIIRSADVIDYYEKMGLPFLHQIFLHQFVSKNVKKAKILVKTNMGNTVNELGVHPGYFL